MLPSYNTFITGTDVKCQKRTKHTDWNDRIDECPKHFATLYIYRAEYLYIHRFALLSMEMLHLHVESLNSYLFQEIFFGLRNILYTIALFPSCSLYQRKRMFQLFFEEKKKISLQNSFSALHYTSGGWSSVSVVL